MAEQVFRRLGVMPIDAPPTARENVANELAGRLLLPSGLLRRVAARCHWDLFVLKQEFRTASHELIARRMLDFSLPVVVTVIDQQRVTWRRSNVPGRVPRQTLREEAVWQRARQTKEAVEDVEGLERWRCWPLHEDDWQREIVRWDLVVMS